MPSESTILSGTFLGLFISLPKGTINSAPIKNQNAVEVSGRMSFKSDEITASCATCSPEPKPSAPIIPSASNDTTINAATISCKSVDIFTPFRLMNIRTIVIPTLNTAGGIASPVISVITFANIAPSAGAAKTLLIK